MNMHKHRICQVIITCGVLATSYMAHHGIDTSIVVGFNAAISLLWIWEN
jgi:hypothetical protein